MVGRRSTERTAMGGNVQGQSERGQPGQDSPTPSQLSKVGADWLVKADTVVEFVRASGVAKTTGQHYESDIVRIWTIRDGKVVKVGSFYDTAAYAIAIDALKLAFQGGHYFKYLEPGRNLAWRHCRP